MDRPTNLSVDYLNLLPDELLLEILVKTNDLETLSKWCRTSKRINNICQDEILWKQKYQEVFGDTILYEGETWQERYKRAVKFPLNSRISAGWGGYGIIDPNGKLCVSGNAELLGIGVKQHQPDHISRKLHLIKFPPKVQDNNLVPSKVVSISISTFIVGAVAAVTKNGSAYIWGNPKSTLFGFRKGTKITYLPKEIRLPTKAIKISINKPGYIILLEDSSVWLNIGINLNYDDEQNFEGLAGIKAIDISIGPDIFAVISEDNQVFVGGKKRGWNRLFSSYIKFPEPMKRITSAAEYIVALSITGKIYELPISNILSNDSLSGLIKLVKLVKMPEPIVQISSGIGTFTALSETGKLYMWGDNGHKQISGDSVEKYKDPVEISVEFPINYVSVGSRFTIAASNDGMVNYWGDPKWKPL